MNIVPCDVTPSSQLYLAPPELRTSAFYADFLARVGTLRRAGLAIARSRAATAAATTAASGERAPGAADGPASSTASASASVEAFPAVAAITLFLTIGGTCPGAFFAPAATALLKVLQGMRRGALAAAPAAWAAPTFGALAGFSAAAAAGEGSSRGAGVALALGLALKRCDLGGVVAALWCILAPEAGTPPPPQRLPAAIVDLVLNELDDESGKPAVVAAAAAAVVAAAAAAPPVLLPTLSGAPGATPVPAAAVGATLAAAPASAAAASAAASSDAPDLGVAAIAALRAARTAAAAAAVAAGAADAGAAAADDVDARTVAVGVLALLSRAAAVWRSNTTVVPAVTRFLIRNGVAWTSGTYAQSGRAIDGRAIYTNEGTHSVCVRWTDSYGWTLRDCSSNGDLFYVLVGLSNEDAARRDFPVARGRFENHMGVENPTPISAWHAACVDAPVRVLCECMCVLVRARL